MPSISARSAGQAIGADSPDTPTATTAILADFLLHTGQATIPTHSAATTAAIPDGAARASFFGAGRFLRFLVKER